MKKTSFNTQMTFSIFLAITLFFSSYSVIGQTTTGVKTKVVFADVELGENLISTDEEERFFDWITDLDMDIQMKNSSKEPTDRETKIEAYRAFLKTDVTSLTDYEKERFSTIMDKCVDQVELKWSELLPEKIYLVKTNGKAYGPSAFYTRGDAIFIPSAMMVAMSDEDLTNVMYHEIFHIISREHPKLRKELYKLIGFRIVSTSISVPPQLAFRMLQNPDGLAYPVLIELESPEDPVWALPVIYSKHPEFDPAKPGFFNYLGFSLYEVKSLNGGVLQVQATEDGATTLTGPWLNQSYFEKIQKNTQYIIHPDEILADNFALLMKGYESEDIQKLSDSGKALISSIEEKMDSFLPE